MPITEFEKQKEVFINNIKTDITEVRELDTLINQFSKIMAKKAAKAKKVQKAKKAFIVQALHSKAKIPALTSLQSTNNISHAEALQELHKMIETWK